jgi:hypothetical protein
VRQLVRFVALLFVLLSEPVWAQQVSLRFDANDPQTAYAANRLSEMLDPKQLQIAASGGGRFTIDLAIDRQLKSEAFAIRAEQGLLRIAGGDGRGLIYGALSVAEELRSGGQLATLKSREEAATLPFRAIKFNLPWDSYRSSSALDLHYDTVRDVRFWKAFLDMMAENRFNALTLWNLHPFPYMIRAKNFPEASRFSDAELAEWRQLFQAIFKMARARGIDTYLVNWNILVSPEFAKAHGLSGTNFYPNYKGQADTSEIVKRYTRESVTQVLEEYPDLTGFGFTLAEQMGGMTPHQRQDWIEETIIAGMRAAKRPVKMIFRAPLSADLGQGGSTSLETERMTRGAVERLGDRFDGPIWMEIKFNWSHGHSSSELVKTHGGLLNDAYFNPAPSNYKIAWTVRNEDFYALRWGVPSFVREHIARNGRHGYVGGYFVGSENYIPAKDYFTAEGGSVDWTYAFERQWLFYKLWGRLLYDPATPDSVFESEFVRRYGEQARPLLQAYALASATQLTYATSVNFTWDFTIYGEGMMVFGARGLAPITVERLITQAPLLPNWLSVEDFVKKQAAGEKLAADSVTPLMVADGLEKDCGRALRLVKDINPAGSRSLVYEIADVKAWAHLGLYFSEKLRAAVALQTYRTTGADAARRAAVGHLEAALQHWDRVSGITRPLYRDMPLAHYNPPDNRRNDQNLFHWALIRPAIKQEVLEAERALAELP